jgi:hypothetical protein
VRHVSCVPPILVCLIMRTNFLVGVTNRILLVALAEENTGLLLPGHYFAGKTKILMKDAQVRTRRRLLSYRRDLEHWPKPPPLTVIIHQFALLDCARRAVLGCYASFVHRVPTLCCCCCKLC